MRRPIPPKQYEREVHLDCCYGNVQDVLDQMMRNEIPLEDAKYVEYEGQTDEWEEGTCNVEFVYRKPRADLEQYHKERKEYDEKMDQYTKEAAKKEYERLKKLYKF